MAWAREVKRVLRDDGVFWLNYGDCYGHGTSAGRIPIDGRDTLNSDAQNINRHGGSAGSLMLMPHRIALALQQDGWIVRQDFVWHKPNPMPESVAGWRWEDGKLRRSSWRHTRAHEYVFMLVKDMQYWSNQEAVRESAEYGYSPTVRGDFAGSIGGEHGQHTVVRGDGIGGRNPRSVANIATAPYSGAHYATFPPNLIAPLIRASCPRWACPECGQGWARVRETAILEASSLMQLNTEPFFYVEYEIDYNGAMRDGGKHARRVGFDVDGEMVWANTNEPLTWEELNYLWSYVVSPYRAGECIHVEGGEPLVHPGGGTEHERFVIDAPRWADD